MRRNMEHPGRLAQGTDHGLFRLGTIVDRSREIKIFNRLGNDLTFFFGARQRQKAEAP